MQARRTKAAGLALAVLAATLGVLSPSAVSPVSAASTTFSMTIVRESVIDPSTGRVFVSGDDKVIAFAPDGTLLATIGGLEGASGMDAEAGSVYVAETTAGTISRINASTLAVTATWATDASAATPLQSSVMVLDHQIWYLLATADSKSNVRQLDPDDGTITPRGDGFTFHRMARIPGRSDQMVGHLLNVGGPVASFVDLTTPTVSVIASLPSLGGKSVWEVAMNHDGTLFTTATGSPRLFAEYVTDTRALTGVSYRGSQSGGQGIAHTSAHGGVYAGAGDSSRILSIFVEGVPSPVATFTTTSDHVDATVTIASDGDTAHIVTEGSGPASRSLATFPLAPSISRVSPTAVAVGVPATVTLEGAGLGGILGATLDGQDVEIGHLSTPNQVTITMPTDRPLGTSNLEVQTRFGSTTAEIDVVPNVGSTIGGRVTAAGTGLAGVDLTLSGGGLPTPMTTTSSASGAYTFPGVPWGTDYRLDAHDPAGTVEDQRLFAITTMPNDYQRVDVTMSTTPSPLQPAPLVADLPLPGGTADVVVDPATGRTFVSSGDLVLVLDADGGIVGQVRDQWTAGHLVLVGDDLFVNRSGAGSIARIDTTTFEVEAVHPTLVPTNGQLAFAGGRLWFATIQNGTYGLSSMDPSTGVVVAGSTFGLQDPGIDAVDGAPDRVVTWPRGTTAGKTQLWDVSTTTPVLVSQTNPTGTARASATDDRLWASLGNERVLSTMQDTAVDYPAAGSGVAHTSARGGMLAFGGRISAQGSAELLARVGFNPRPDATEFASDGLRIVAGDELYGKVLIWDLRPVISAVTPPRVQRSAPTPIQLTGYNLDGTSQVTVDGTEATVNVDANGRVTFELPATTSVGTSDVVLTTPFGETTVDLEVVDSTMPSDVELVAGSASATLSFEAPSLDDGVELLGFEVANNDATQTFTLPPAQRVVTIHPLDPGQAVTFRLRTLTSLGASAWVDAGPAVPLALAPAFADVPVGHPFFWEILTGRVEGTSTGYPDGTFRGGEIVSRQAAVTFLWRAAGEPTADDGDVPYPDPPFSDVPADHPFRDAIAWAAAEGITTGNADGTFRPGAPVTRHAWVTFQWRAAGEPDPDCDDIAFTDVPAGYPNHRAILWAACTGITTGYSDGTFRPTESVSRQAAIAFLVRPTWPDWKPFADV